MVRSRRCDLRSRNLVAGVTILILMLGASQHLRAGSGSDEPLVDLIVGVGRPIRVALDERIELKHIGQPVTGSVTEPVYAYDRIVIAVGAKVRGHVIRIDSGSTLARARAYFNGNFSPTKHAVLRFDTL